MSPVAVETFGKLDVLASNAGVWVPVPLPSSIFRRRCSDARWRSISTHAFCAGAGRREPDERTKERAERSLRQARSAPSSAGAMQTHYTPSKAGVHSLMQVAAISALALSIRCNSVLPGAILTDLVREDLHRPGENALYFEKRIPLGRLRRAIRRGGLALSSLLPARPQRHGAHVLGRRRHVRQFDSTA